MSRQSSRKSTSRRSPPESRRERTARASTAGDSKVRGSTPRASAVRASVRVDTISMSQTAETLKRNGTTVEGAIESAPEAATSCKKWRARGPGLQLCDILLEFNTGLEFNTD